MAKTKGGSGGNLKSKGKEKQGDQPNEANKLKRKAHEIGGSSANLPTVGGIQSELPAGAGSPVVVDAKELRKVKRKAALLNYKQLEVKPAEDYTSLFTRSTPCVLYKAVGEMSDLQYFGVAQMGFDDLLEILIKDMPGKLNYWLLDCFNYKRCELVLPCGSRIPVTADDVHRVFGFPKGGKSMLNAKKEDNADLYEQWKAFFPNTNPRLIKMNELKDVMLSCEDGGRWFKINFLLMVAHCLIESTTNGCINPRILGCLDDLNIVREWNWCEYAIDSLIRNKEEWEKDTTSYYIGPTLFLTIFYVDRVRWANCNVRRDFPLFKNWSSKELRDRESKEIKSAGFGDGLLMDPIPMPEVKRLSKSERLAKMVEVYVKNRDDILHFINSVDVALLEDESFKASLDYARRHLTHPPCLLTSLPVERVKIPRRSTDDVMGTPKGATDRLEDYCLGVTQMLKDDSTNARMTGDNDVGSKGKEAIGVSNNVGEVRDGNSKFASSNVIENADIGCDSGGSLDADGQLHGSDENNVGKPPVSVIAATNYVSGESSMNVVKAPVYVTAAANCESGERSVGLEVTARQADVVPVRRVRTNMARTLKNIEKENVVSENPTTLVKGACVGGENGKRLVLKPIPENDMVDHVGMRCRSKGLLKKTNYNLSPFMERSVSTTKRLNKKEKALALFGMYNQKEDNVEVMFQYDNTILQRMHMATLCRDNVVGPEVITAWAICLNMNEEFRSDASPARFFASVEICFCFPVYRIMNFFMVCVDIRKEKAYVLDSRNETPLQCRDEKYLSTVNDVKQMLGDYMGHLGHVHKSNIVKR